MSTVEAGQEITRLVSLAQASTPETRTELYLSIVQLMENAKRAFTDAESQLLAAIMRQLAHQVEMEVRRALAERVAEQGDASHDLLLLLANDDIRVAQPILEKSSLLTEGDLLGLIETCDALHHLTIAGRHDVTMRIAAQLAESPSMDVLIALADNASAQISEATLDKMAERSRASTDLQRSILQRPDIRGDLTARMCAFVTEALHGYITQRFNIDPVAISRDLAIASVEAHARLTNASPAERLVGKLYAAGQLKPGFAIKSLAQGQLDILEHAVAKLVGAPADAVARMLKSGEVRVVALICQAIGVDKSVFPTLYAQAETLRGRSGILSQQDRRKADEIFLSLTRDDARIAMLRQAA